MLSVEARRSKFQAPLFTVFWNRTRASDSGVGVLETVSAVFADSSRAEISSFVLARCLTDFQISNCFYYHVHSSFPLYSLK